MTFTSKVVDTSALTAVVLDEPSASEIEERLRERGALLIAAPSLLELRMVLAGRYARDAQQDLETLRERFGFTIVHFTEIHADAAFDAWPRYGKGRHPAALNFGDCMVYAVAKVAGAELVYVGDDFARTDLA